jgi:hypothetical protein
MEADAAQLDLFSLRRRRAQKPGKPRERNAERPAVGQFDPHCVFVKADANC